MRALVTGASGFVGRHLVPYLQKKGIKVWASYHKTSFDFSLPIHWLRADLTRSEETLELVRQSRPDFVFHLAGQPVPAESWKDSLHTLKVNAEASVYLMEGVARFAPQARVVLISTSQVYGMTFFDKPRVSEKDLVQPLSPYAGSKALMEMAGLNFARRHQLKLVIARVFNQYGPGQRANFVFSDFCRQIALIEKGKRPPILKVGALSVVRDFIPVRDAVSAYDVLARRGRPGEIYNVSMGKGMRLGSALDFLVRQSRVALKVERLSSKFRSNDFPAMFGDSSKLRRLGWRPGKSTWRENLLELLEDWRQKT